MDYPTLEREIEISTSRSSGPGGQHVNKTETKVELRWNLGSSKAASESEKRRLRHHLRKRLTEDDVLIITEQSSRSQHRNRELAHREFKRLLKNGLKPIPKKRKAGAFKANDRKRKKEKERRSEKKAWRKKLY
ncbi:MAG: alternative ribosome rescue aminoacyl-tRNA hydrolase ArfB [Bacteroidota bacterium]